MSTTRRPLIGGVTYQASHRDAMNGACDLLDLRDRLLPDEPPVRARVYKDAITGWTWHYIDTNTTPGRNMS